MKKNIIRNALVATIVIVAGFNVYQSNVNNEKMSDIVLENVEALAQNEAGDWYCIGEFYTCLLDEQGRIYGKKYNLK